MFKRYFLFFLLTCCQAFSSLLTDSQGPTPPLIGILETLEISPYRQIEDLATALREKCLQTGDRWTFRERFDEKRETLLPLLDDLGCFNSVYASDTHYTYGVVLGALRIVVQKRIDFLISEWKRGIRFEKIIFLTGKRELRASEGCEDLTSETEMMLYVWNETKMPSELRKVPLTVVDSPPAPGRDRATTESTVFAWLETKSSPGSCLVISSQPYVGYQDSILKACLPSSFQIETVGPSGGRSLPTAVLMDNLSKWLLWSIK